VGPSGRTNIAAVTASNAALTGFNAVPNGQVFSVMPGPNDHSVYVGGSFTSVSGNAAKLTELMSYFDDFDPAFNIIEPRANR